MMDTCLFDVVAVNFETLKVRLLAEAKRESAAEKIVEIAVFRRGVETEFYSEVPSGSYLEGDKWEGDKRDGHQADSGTDRGGRIMPPAGEKGVNNDA